MEEILKAVKTFQPGKTPGPNGIPVEFYKLYAYVLAPRLHSVLAGSMEVGRLSALMGDVVIVVIPKPGKDPSLCSSYRPISLLNVDAKLLSKIMANRLNTGITELIHLDQTGGSCQGRGTDNNIRRLYTHIAMASLDRAGVVASDSAEWGYLWEVLSKFGYGPQFLNWIRILYAAPKACVRTNGGLSGPFSLGQGTRSGCPLSSGLFALALEPLAILLRVDQEVGGYSGGASGGKVVPLCR